MIIAIDNTVNINSKEINSLLGLQCSRKKTAAEKTDAGLNIKGQEMGMAGLWLAEVLAKGRSNLDTASASHIRQDINIATASTFHE